MKQSGNKKTGKKSYPPKKQGWKNKAGKGNQGSKSKPRKSTYADDNKIRLNRYIANAGVCSRREADVIITTGAVTVNGKIVTELGVKVDRSDVVKVNGEKIRAEQPQYLLMNKPKDFITTVNDPQGRKTVMHLVRRACKERIYPVGRLDRDTTGLLLFTNDGDLAKRLTHPKHRIKKVYHVFTEKNVKAEHLKQWTEGIELEDGFIKADAVSYVKDNKKQVGIELHSGKNRIVRRMFEHFGYKIKRLDRVYFAGLTKKDLPRGKYRFLSQQEITLLKMIK